MKIKESRISIFFDSCILTIEIIMTENNNSQIRKQQVQENLPDRGGLFFARPGPKNGENTYGEVFFGTLRYKEKI